MSKENCKHEHKSITPEGFLVCTDCGLELDDNSYQTSYSEEEIKLLEMGHSPDPLTYFIYNRKNNREFEPWGFKSGKGKKHKKYGKVLWKSSIHYGMDLRCPIYLPFVAIDLGFNCATFIGFIYAIIVYSNELMRVINFFNILLIVLIIVNIICLPFVYEAFCTLFTYITLYEQGFIFRTPWFPFKKKYYTYHSIKDIKVESSGITAVGIVPDYSDMSRSIYPLRIPRGKLNIYLKNGNILGVSIAWVSNPKRVKELLLFQCKKNYVKFND
ncbi:MAG: hypothetical protein EAX89_17640 [Candidatus Lokiarchaeota archaeon]|nr:hypothetical protein [Candidatus Lokiarchaeota archaeon]